MKQPKKLTRFQKIALSKKGYNPDELGYIGTVGNSDVFINLTTKEKVMLTKLS